MKKQEFNKIKKEIIYYLDRGFTVNDLFKDLKLVVERETEQKVIRWIYNYWKTLKSHGMTEKQLIIKMNSFFEKQLND